MKKKEFDTTLWNNGQRVYNKITKRKEKIHTIDFHNREIHLWSKGDKTGIMYVAYKDVELLSTI